MGVNFEGDIAVDGRDRNERRKRCRRWRGRERQKKETHEDSLKPSVNSEFPIERASSARVGLSRRRGGYLMSARCKTISIRAEL